MKSSWLIEAALAVTAAVFLPGCTKLGFGRGPEGKDNVVTVTKQDLMSKVTVAGLLIPFRRTMFSPAYNAYVKKFFVKLGDEVKEGTPILTLSQSLRGIAEENYPLRAPFPGRVVQVLKSEGEYVETGKDGSGILRIDDLSKLFITSDVPENDINRIRVGQEVLVKANPILDRSYKGIIRNIAIAAKERKEGWNQNGNRVEFEVRIEIVDKDDRLRPGMSAIVDIVTDNKKGVLALKHEYVQHDKDKYSVTLESGDKKDVLVGSQNEESVEITGGLKEGDRVRMVDFFSLPKLD